MAFCRTLAVGTTGGVVDGLLLAQGSEGGAGGIATAVVAAVAAVAGVLLTASATAYAARRKTAEIRLVYQQQLADRYLENARQYTNAIYVPLSTALSPDPSRISGG